MNNLENLIGKKVMFRETEKKTNIFYYDATIKKIGDTFFLKFNQPDLRIFDFYSLGEAKRPKTNLAIARLLFRRIAELDKDKKQNVYKFSYPLGAITGNKDRYKDICELSVKNIVAGLSTKHQKKTKEIK